MTLQPALIAYLNGQIAAGLAPEQIRSTLRYALAEWGAETDIEEIVSYLYERLRNDALLRETLRVMLARSLSPEESIGMPDEMDAQIRQRLFATTDRKAPRAEPVRRGRDHPQFELFTVDPDWKTAGPVLSRLVWLAHEYERAWQASEGRPEQPTARRQTILWRAVARAGHLDPTALTELQAYQDIQPLDPDILAELEDLQSKMQKMLDGIHGLLDAARLKEPHAR